MKKHLKSILFVFVTLTFTTFAVAQQNAVYPDNSGVPGSQNVLVGLDAGNSLNASSKNNTFTGTQAGASVSGTSINSYYGYSAGFKHEGVGNTFVGALAGEFGESKYSSYLGYAAGNGTFGNTNVMIGAKAGSGLGNVDNQLYIGIGAGTPLIYGDFAQGIAGINTTAPISTFDVRGSNVIVTDPGTTAGTYIFNRAASMGQAGGPPGTSPCNLYGFRAQTDINNAVNVGMDANIPTVLWGSTTDDLTFGVRNASGNPNCYTRILRMGNNLGGLQFFLEGSGLVTGSWTVISDRKLKKEIKTINNAMDLVKQLNGVTYSFDREKNPSMNLPEGTVYGFIAQEVQAVIPEVTTTVRENGLVGVKYTEIIPLLTEGMKEQQAIIETQEELIAEQQTQLETLEERLATIEQMLSTSQRSETTNSNAATISKGIKLSQNSPNPFGNITTINYEIPTDAQNATLDVFNMNGQLLQSFDIQGGAGVVEVNGKDLQSGTYVYAINIGGANVATNIMIVQK